MVVDSGSIETPPRQGTSVVHCDGLPEIGLKGQFSTGRKWSGGAMGQQAGNQSRRARGRVVHATYPIVRPASIRAVWPSLSVRRHVPTSPIRPACSLCHCVSRSNRSSPAARQLLKVADQLIDILAAGFHEDAITIVPRQLAAEAACDLVDGGGVFGEPALVTERDRTRVAGGALHVPQSPCR